AARQPRPHPRQRREPRRAALDGLSPERASTVGWCALTAAHRAKPRRLARLPAERGNDAGRPTRRERSDETMSQGDKGLSRRELLGRAGAGAAVGLGMAAGVLPRRVEASRSARAVAPSEKIVLGLIGCGGMGAANMRTLMGKPGVEVAALCDVDTAR